MKYIDADLLRKEIERHLERATAEQEKFPDMPKYRWYLREGKKELCNDLLDYMYDTLGVEEPITDSLQQEQPEMDLEKEIDACWQNWLSPSNQKEVEGVLPKTEFAMYASHFYELGRQAKPEIFDTMAFQKGMQEGRRLERDEPVTDCHDLKEEIERTYHDGSVTDTDDMDHVDYENIARHFAEWQKRKMMDDAVEAKVKADLDPHGADYGIRYLYVRMPDNSPIGDKVRIIIVKEEE